MAITLTACHVYGATVARVTDLEGGVAQVICPYYDEVHQTCTLQAGAFSGGPLARLIEHVAEDTLAHRGRHCALVDGLR